MYKVESKKPLNIMLKEARSESMTKWIGRLEEETEIVSSGGTPTERMEDLIEKIKLAIEVGGSLDVSINQLVQSSYKQGVQDGFSKALSKFQNGSITTRKVPKELSWTLSTSSTQYQVTARLPTVEGGEQRSTVIIKLSAYGFK